MQPSPTKNPRSSLRLPKLGTAVTSTVLAASVVLVGCLPEEPPSIDLRPSAARDENPITGASPDANANANDEPNANAGGAGGEAADAGPSANANEDAGSVDGGDQAPSTPTSSVGDPFRTTAELNLRAGPGTEHAIILTLPNDAVVALVAAAPTNGFYNVKYASLTGWASAKFLVAAPGAKVEDFPMQEIISPVEIRPHVQAFANVACGTVGCPDTVSTYHGHQPSVYLALDVFQLKERGDKFAAFAVADKTHRLDYVIWYQRINMRDGNGWTWMEDRGSVTQNHYDHVHVSFNP